MKIIRQKEYSFSDEEIRRAAYIPMAGAGIGYLVGHEIGSTKGGKKVTEEELRELAEKEARKEESYADNLERNKYGLGEEFDDEDFKDLDTLDLAEYEMNKEAADNARERAKNLRNNPELVRNKSKAAEKGAKKGGTVGGIIGGAGTAGAMLLIKKLAKK